MAPVTGTVLLEGESFPAGKVVFTPLEEGKLAIGNLKEDGSFALKTGANDEGAIIGKYRVTVDGFSSAKELKFRKTYVSPQDKPAEVVAGEDNQLEINITLEEGWRSFIDGN